MSWQTPFPGDTVIDLGYDNTEWLVREPGTICSKRDATFSIIQHLHSLLGNDPETFGTTISRLLTHTQWTWGEWAFIGVPGEEDAQLVKYVQGSTSDHEYAGWGWYAGPRAFSDAHSVNAANIPNTEPTDTSTENAEGTPKRYRTRTKNVSAVQWLGHNRKDFMALANGVYDPTGLEANSAWCVLEEGGRLNLWADDAFGKHYEPVPALIRTVDDIDQLPNGTVLQVGPVKKTDNNIFPGAVFVVRDHCDPALKTLHHGIQVWAGKTRIPKEDIFIYADTLSVIRLGGEQQ